MTRTLLRSVAAACAHHGDKACTARSPAQAADLLKDLPERLPATFVYAGINVTDNPCSPAPAAPSSPDAPPSSPAAPSPPGRGGSHGTREPFRDVITDIDNALDLTHHKPGTLHRHATYLHQRTAARIGSLTHLIRQAAITAIHDGTERITKTALERYNSTTSPNNTTAPPATANPPPTEHAKQP
ncbi:hypothetical protein GCM10010234_50940 [Streptomyces hawaiiensis]